MRKLAKLGLFVFIFSLVACEETSNSPPASTGGNNSSNSSNNNAVANGTNCATSSNNAIDYLNCFRGLAGLTALTSDSFLQTATLSHAKYLNANNASGHNQTLGLPSFSGTTGNARVAGVGYKSGISENVTTHGSSSADFKDSIEALMSAIYHRFGFLDNEIDKIGASENQTDSQKVKAFVYNMSNNAINELCKGSAFNGPGTIIFACLDSLGVADTNHSIDYSLYQTAKLNIANINPSIIKWPAQSSIDVVPVFNTEIPHPTPGFSVSGYPVSVEFNQHKFSSPPTVSAFSLTNVATSNVQSVITVMNKNNDPNTQFNGYQHALFPTNRLEWATKYKVDVNYNDGSEKSLSWTFTTRNLGITVHTVSGNNPTINGVVSGQPFAIYVPPRNNTDSLLSHNYVFSGSIALDIQFIDSNTLQVTATGSGSVTLNYHGSAINFTI